MHHHRHHHHRSFKAYLFVAICLAVFYLFLLGMVSSSTKDTYKHEDELTPIYNQQLQTIDDQLK